MFKYIYSTCFSKLYRYGFQFTHNRELIEDSIQELFVDLRDRRSFLSPVDRIMPYIYSAFRRKLIKLRERESRHVALPTRDAYNFLVTVSREDEIVDRQVEKERRQLLERALTELPERYQVILFHYFYENLSYEDIRLILGFKHVKSVRNLMYRAITSLKTHIAGGSMQSQRFNPAGRTHLPDLE